jgi:hypothetical protein
MQPDEKQLTSNAMMGKLNDHGHSFQYAVLRHLHEIWSRGQFDWSWRSEVTEFPVVVKSETVHVDFVLFGRSQWSTPRYSYLIAECKRVNPRLGRWCFARTPYTDEGLVLDRFELSHNKYVSGAQIRSMPLTKYPESNPYQLGLELRTGANSAKDSPGRNAINDATTQVLRASSGLVNYVLNSGNVLPDISPSEQL